MRNNKIDFLRFIGLSMIILAHVSPPALFFQIRNFDVPLMLLVSGMSFGIAYKNESYFHYLWKRMKRLIFPVWLFLTLYFISIYLFRPSSETLNLHSILTSYFFIGGGSLGYVWIIRVFILVAIIAPFIYLLNKNSSSNTSYLIKLFCLLIIYEVCRYLSMPYIENGIGKYLSLLFLYMVPYSILFALGLRIPSFDIKTNLKLLLIFMAFFLGIAVYLWGRTGDFVPTQNYKYPPSIYYFSYAITVSIFLWVYVDKALIFIYRCNAATNTIFFIAQNTIWIYLWHIPLVMIMDPGMNFGIKYIVIYSLAACITFIQVWFVKNVLMLRTSNQRIKNNMKMILTG